MNNEIDYTLLNLLLISLPIIILEAIVGGTERYKILNNLDTRNKSTDSIINITTSKISNVSINLELNLIINNSTSNDRNKSNVLSASKSNVLSASKSNELHKTKQSNLETNELLIDKKSIENLSEENLISKDKQEIQEATSSNKKSIELLKSKNSNLIFSTNFKLILVNRLKLIHILTYICLIILILFLTIYFRSIIKLYNFIYLFIIGLITFINLFLFLNRIYSMLDKLFKLNSIIKNRRLSKSIFNLIQIINLIISFSIAYYLAYLWFINRLNLDFWFYHNLIGLEIAIFIVYNLSFLKFNQILIILSFYMFLDLFLSLFSKYFFNHLIRSLIKRNIIIEDLGLLDDNKNLNLEHYRLPSIYFIPKFNLIDAFLNDFDSINFSLEQKFSFIGIGDLIISGILASFCFFFDKFKKINYIYLLTSLFSNLLSLILMFVINDLFNANGQPVLCYTVPINFILLTSIALYRKEFKEFCFFNVQNYSTVNQNFKEEEESDDFS